MSLIDWRLLGKYDFCPQLQVPSKSKLSFTDNSNNFEATTSSLCPSTYLIIVVHDKGEKEMSVKLEIIAIYCILRKERNKVSGAVKEEARHSFPFFPFSLTRQINIHQNKMILRNTLPLNSLSLLPSLLSIIPLSFSSSLIWRKVFIIIVCS